MGLAVGGEREAQRLLGRGLADRAGDGDHLALEARARGAGEIAQGLEHVVDDEQRRVGGEARAHVAGDDGQARAGLERVVDEVVAVARLALDGEEGLAARQAAAVDGDAGDVGRQRAGWRRRAWRRPCRTVVQRAVMRASSRLVVPGAAQREAVRCETRDPQLNSAYGCPGLRLQRCVMRCARDTIARTLLMPPHPSTPPPPPRGRKSAAPGRRRSGRFHGLCRRSTGHRRARARRWRRGSPPRGRRSRWRPCASARIAARMPGGVLAARIVVGDDDAVGGLGGDAAHDRPLAGVAVAAGAEHDDELAGRIGPQRLERLLQRVGLVRVIDEDRRAIALAGEFEAALGAFELSPARRRRARARRRWRCISPRRARRCAPGSRRPKAASRCSRVRHAPASRAARSRRWRRRRGGCRRRSRRPS